MNHIQSKMAKQESKQTLPDGKGWIYCLSNPAMPGLVEVGAVTNSSRGYPPNMEYEFDDAMMDALITPGVPFKVEISELSLDPTADIKFVHAILDSAGHRYGIVNQAPQTHHSCMRNAHNQYFFTAPLEIVMRAFIECRYVGPNGQLTNLQKEKNARGGCLGDGEKEKEQEHDEGKNDEKEQEEIRDRITAWGCDEDEPRLVRTDHRDWVHHRWSAYCDKEKERIKENEEYERYEKDRKY